jgi:hypothetical protein
MLQFLPENLNLDEILQNNPPLFKYHRDGFIHILNLLTEIPSKKKDLMDEKGYVPINAELLKKRVHNYAHYLGYLIDAGVIETDGFYVRGEKSRGYRFTEKYQTFVAPAEIQRYTLLKAINGQSNYDRNMQAKYNYLYKWMDGLRIDFRAAKSFLDMQFQQDKKSNHYKAVRKYNANIATAMYMKENLARFRVDETSGRLHTYLSCLKKELRNFVSYDGQPLVSVDIVCSQPTLTQVLLKSEFYLDIEDKMGAANIFRIAPGSIKQIPVGEIARLVYSKQDTFVKYREAIQSDIYNYMRPYLEAITGHSWSERRDIKDAMFGILYSDNRFIGQKKAAPKRIFRELFPEVYELFALYKKHGSSQLPVLLQKLEVRLVLDRAAKKLSKLLPDIPIYTIHDSIIMPAGNEKIISTTLQEEAQSALGITIKTEPEIWVPEFAVKEQSTIAA